MKDGLDKVGGTLTDAGNAVIDTAGLLGDGFKDLGHGLTDGLNNAGHEIEHIGSSIGHAIGGTRNNIINFNTYKQKRM
jgi:hypothetical protein